MSDEYYELGDIIEHIQETNHKLDRMIKILEKLATPDQVVEALFVSDMGDLIRFDCICGKEELDIVFDGVIENKCECGRIWRLERDSKVVLINQSPDQVAQPETYPEHLSHCKNCQEEFTKDIKKSMDEINKGEYEIITKDSLKTIFDEKEKEV